MAWWPLAAVSGASSYLLPGRRAARVEGRDPLRAPRADRRGLKVGALQGVTAAVVGEYIGSSAGLGFLGLQGQGNADMATVVFTLGLLALPGWLLYALIGCAEKLLTSRFS